MKKIVLKNGVRLMLMPNKSTGVVTIMTMFGVGSRHESDKLAGISHLLEHMNYKGTLKRPTFLEVAEFIESIGGEHNAFTGKEYTAYYTKVTPKHLEKGVDFVSDNVLHSTYDSEELKKEKGVIIEEINMYEDQPMENIDNKFEEALFGKNALGRDIIGTKESVSGLERDDLLEYRKHHYTAENCVVAMAGNFGETTEAQIEKLIEEKFVFTGTKAVSKAGSPENPEQIVLNQSKSVIIVPKKTEQSHLMIGFFGPPFVSEDRSALKLLGVILGGSMSSRMFVEVREKRGLAYAVRTSFGCYREAGSIETQAGVPHSKVKETIKAILDEYRKVTEKEVTESELSRVKEILNGQTMIDLEDSFEVADHYARYETIAGVTKSPEEILKEYEKVRPSDILKIAKKYLVDNRMSLAYIGPALEEKDITNLFML